MWPNAPVVISRFGIGRSYMCIYFMLISDKKWGCRGEGNENINCHNIEQKRGKKGKEILRKRQRESVRGARQNVTGSSSPPVPVIWK